MFLLSTKLQMEAKLLVVVPRDYNRGAYSRPCHVHGLDQGKILSFDILIISRTESAIKSVVSSKKRKWRRWRQIQIRRWEMFVKSSRCKLNDFRQRL